MKLTLLGATQTVTGSKFLIETKDRRILVDCGLFQGSKELRLRNWEQPPVDPKSIDAVVLTHAHIDHTGYLPRFVAHGYKRACLCNTSNCHRGNERSHCRVPSRLGCRNPGVSSDLR